jgi:hypothetical protein
MTIDPRVSRLLQPHGILAFAVVAVAVGTRLGTADWLSFGRTSHGAGVQVPGTAGVPASPSHDLGLFPRRPDPARVSVTLRYALPRGADVRLAIFDVSGSRIRSLVSELQSAGEHAVDWDLRDEQGRAVNAGVYFARLDVEHRTLMRTLATVK